MIVLRPLPDLARQPDLRRWVSSISAMAETTITTLRNLPVAIGASTIRLFPKLVEALRMTLRPYADAPGGWTSASHSATFTSPYE